MAVARDAPKAEIGAQAQQNGGPQGWSAFVDEAEYVPELSWPASIPTYHQMRSDSQLEALHLGTMLPVREYRWSLDPNGAGAAITERASGDLGLPVRGHEDDNVPRSAASFDFDDFLADALLAPLYGFFDFEIAGAVNPDASEWHIDRLAPRHPRTIADFRTSPTGELEAIRQNIGGAGGALRMPPPIPASRLVRFVWRSEAGSHVGRSMLRSLYREWLVKDRTIRVAAINVERAGGMPVVEGPQGASDPQLAQLAQLARQFKVAEGGGGAIPFGSKLHLVGGSTPDAISLLEYCDQAMARVWALMLVQLGQTRTGSRALGGEFSGYAARTQRAIAGWICAVVNRLLDRYVEWNLGPSARYAPRLVFEQTQPDALSVDNLVALITSGALTVDPELEAWLRSERGLPPMPEPADGGAELGALTPEEEALVRNARNPPPVPPPGGDTPPPPAPASQTPPSVQAAARLEHRREIYAAAMLPDRTLRRQPYDHEVRAAIDFRGLDVAHEQILGNLEGFHARSIVPAQISAIGEQIVTTQAGTPRQRLTRSAMSGLNAPAVGRDEIVQHLAAAARNGASTAVAELAVQGHAGLEVPGDEALAALVGDQADAVAALAAHSISLSAQRRAQSLVGGGRTPEQLRGEVEAHLGGLQHAWTRAQLQGAVTFAQNVGRVTVFEAAEGRGASLSYYASEILDANCCSPCTSIDGTNYSSLADASRDYAAGGYVDCAGGPNCRGTLVAVAAEQNPLSESNPVLSGVA